MTDHGLPGVARGTVLVIDAPAEGSGPPPLARRLVAAGMPVRSVPWREQQGEALLATAAHDVAVVVLGPGLVNPASVARLVRRFIPAASFVFAAPAGREQALRNSLVYSAPGGTVWRVAAEGEELTQAVAEALRAVAKSRQLRTTLDRINMQVQASHDLQGADYRRLVISDHFLASLLHTAEDAIVSLGLDGTILSWNEGAERLLHVTASDAVGRRISAIAGWSEDPQRLVSQVASGEPVRRDVGVAVEGRSLEVDARFNPVRDGAGGTIAVAAILRDVTEARRMQRERDSLLAAERAARSEAERAGFIKDEFLSILSHELRTPLTAIVGYVHLLRMKPLPPDVAKGLEVIDRNARSQGQIVSDLLDMSRIISGKLRLEVERIDPAATVEAGIESLMPAIQAKQIRLQKIIDTRLPRIAADPHRLQQVVWNLVSNAVKFTGKGGLVQVVLRQAESQIELEVRDTGAGIGPDFLPHVFDRFRQQDASTTRRHGGLGLGLSIVKQLVELHGGAIEVESAGIGRGATFRVRLPVAAVRHEDTAGAEPTASAAEAGGVEGLGLPRLDARRVLIVDDEPDARAMLERLLQAYGAEAEVADSGSAALAMLHERPFDMLVSDIGMPNMDGYELIRRVRAFEEERVRAIPAVALTAFARAEDRRRALMAGYQMHIGKPVDPAELIAVVSSLARRP